MRVAKAAFCAVALAIVYLVTPAQAADSLNIYSARHYDSDEQLYDGFQDATGIPVNVIEGEGPELLARMKAEGRSSPADVFLTVDAGNLWLAEKENLFQPAQSKILDTRVPASLKSPKNLWFGFSTRARLIFVNAARVDPKLVQTYESLADPRLKGKICMRSSSAVYNLSLMGALIAHWGPAKAEEWAKGRYHALAECRGRRMRGHARQSLLLRPASDLEGQSRAGRREETDADFPGPGRAWHACEYLGCGHQGLGAA
jgi:iron(III) transport system substrate-binding protein